MQPTAKKDEGRTAVIAAAYPDLSSHPGRPSTLLSPCWGEGAVAHAARRAASFANAHPRIHRGEPVPLLHRSSSLGLFLLHAQGMG